MLESHLTKAEPAGQHRTRASDPQRRHGARRRRGYFCRYLSFVIRVSPRVRVSKGQFLWDYRIHIAKEAHVLGFDCRKKQQLFDYELICLAVEQSARHWRVGLRGGAREILVTIAKSASNVCYLPNFIFRPSFTYSSIFLSLVMIVRSF